MNDSCLILFADQKSTTVSEKTVSDYEKNEIIKRAFPKGSFWKSYSGGRSLACFSIDNSSRFALCYSAITDSTVVPLVDFIIILREYNLIASIIQRGLPGIQSAYFRRINRFVNLNKTQSKLLIQNILLLRATGKEKFPNITISKKYRYEDAIQWRNIENAIIHLAFSKTKGIFDFRTLSLEIDDDFWLTGVAEKNFSP